jgi:hypothetical protein
MLKLDFTLTLTCRSRCLAIVLIRILSALIPHLHICIAAKSCGMACTLYGPKMSQ